MAYHPPRDVSPFRRRYLIPLWVIRIFFMGLSIVANGIAVGALSYYESTGRIYELNSSYNLKAAIGVAIALGVVIMVAVIICLVLDIVCIIKRYRHTLKPRFFLIINIVQTTLWTVMFIVGFFGVFSILSIIVSLIPLMAFWAMLIYAAIIHSRERRGVLNRGAYTPRANNSEFHMQNTSYTVHDDQPYAQNYPEPKYDQTAPGPQQTYAQPHDAQNQGYVAQVLAPAHQNQASTGGQTYDSSYYGPVYTGQGPDAHGSGV